MAKLDPSRMSRSVESLQHATDPTGKVVGYYLGMSDGTEAFVADEWVRAHFTAAPRAIPQTEPALGAIAPSAPAAPTTK